MTDSNPNPFDPGEIAAELEKLARDVPAVPSDFSELRRLLALLPDPIGNETPSTASGDPGLFSVGAATPNQSSSSILGQAPGMTPYSSIGGMTAAPVTAIETNLIDDAPLDTLAGGGAIPPKSGLLQASSDFDAWYELASGLNPQWQLYTVQRTADANPFNSGQIRLGAFPVIACDSTASVFGPGVYGTGKALWAPHLAFAFVVGQVRVFRPSGNVYTSVAALTMQLELWREYRSGTARETMLDQTAALDILGMNDSAQSLLKVAAATSNFTEGEHATIVVKLRIQASAPGGSVVIGFAEPSLSMNATQDAPAFGPLLSHYRPVQDDFMAYAYFGF